MTFIVCKRSIFSFRKELQEAESAFRSDPANEDLKARVDGLKKKQKEIEKDFYGFIEYYLNGLGKNNYPDALLDPDITERLARGELFVIGRNYLSGHIQVELHPLFKVFFTAINNIEDPSGILQPYVTWDITQNLQLTGGVNVYYGAKGTEFGGFKAPQTDLIIKSPDNVYIWLTYFF